MTTIKIERMRMIAKAAENVERQLEVKEKHRYEKIDRKSFGERIKRARGPGMERSDEKRKQRLARNRSIHTKYPDFEHDSYDLVYTGEDSLTKDKLFELHDDKYGKIIPFYLSPGDSLRKVLESWKINLLNY